MAQTESNTGVLELAMLRGVYARTENGRNIQYGTSGETDPETGEYVQRHSIRIDTADPGYEKLVAHLAGMGFVDSTHPGVASILQEIKKRRDKLRSQGPRDTAPVVEEEMDIDTLLAKKPEDIVGVVKTLTSKGDLDALKETEAKGRARTTVLNAVEAQLKKVSG